MPTSLNPENHIVLQCTYYDQLCLPNLVYLNERNPNKVEVSGRLCGSDKATMSDDMIPTPGDEETLLVS